MERSEASRVVTERITSNKNMKWRFRVRLLLKIFLVIACIIGFTYQATHFLYLYYSYPVDTSVTIRHQNMLEMPAISMCNFNSYRRTEFCKLFPDKCELWEMNDTMCETWPYYCFSSERSLLVPKVNSSQLLTYNRSVHVQISHTYNGLVGTCKLTINKSHSRSCESFSKPFAFQCINDWFNPTMCYTINFYWLKDKKEELVIPDTAVLTMNLYPEEQEFFPDSWYPGFQIAVHPEKSMVNPFARGHTFLSGRSYYIDVSMMETYLLPSPYISHCEPYIPAWNAVDGAEPSNKQSCENKCLLRRSIELYGCAIYSLLYPHNQTICSSQREMSSKEIRECEKKCPLPCYIREYKLRVNEYPQFKDSPECRSGRCSRQLCTRTTLNFKFSEFTVAAYTLKPKYTYIEIFSNLGGYLGMWLGVSLLSLFDITLPLLHYIRTKLSHTKKRKIFARKTFPRNYNMAVKNTSRHSETFIAHG